MPRTEPRVSTTSVPPPPPPEQCPIYRNRPLRNGESLKLLPVDGTFYRFIVRSVNFLSTTMDWPSDDFMDGVMVRAFTNNMSKPRFYELSWLDALPGRLQAWASRAEATNTKKDHSTRTRNGHLVFHTETYMRHLVRAIQKKEDEETYLREMYNECDVPEAEEPPFDGPDGDEPEEIFELLTPAIRASQRQAIYELTASFFPNADLEVADLAGSFFFTVEAPRSVVRQFCSSMASAGLLVETTPVL